ncbi:MAG: hypothetical protein ACFE0I_02465 [Elainellaceae cyanobacterium]
MDAIRDILAILGIVACFQWMGFDWVDLLKDSGIQEYLNEQQQVESEPEMGTPGFHNWFGGSGDKPETENQNSTSNPVDPCGDSAIIQASERLGNPLDCGEEVI